MVVAALSYIQYKQWKAAAALLPIISDLLKWRRDLKIADARCRRQNSLSNKDRRRRIYLQHTTVTNPASRHLSEASRLLAIQ
jgi:hypothetical protein